ncbi:MAG: Autoinducer 2 sensor kinase/phosphatase LuxQ, partial [Pseudomonadota bacterium]
EFKGEWEVLRGDGQTANVMAESVRVPGADGRTHRLVYVVDISERKRLEMVLQEAHHFLQSVIDGLAAHVCVLDESGLLIAVNRAWTAFAAAHGGEVATTGVGTSYLRAAEAGAAQGLEPLDFLPRLREVLAGRSAGFEAEYACHSASQQRRSRKRSEEHNSRPRPCRSRLMKTRWS